MAELKPCPFCGGKAEFEQIANGTTEQNSCQFRFIIRCVKCGAMATKGSGYIDINLNPNGELNLWRDDTAKAAEAWNRRADNG